MEVSFRRDIRLGKLTLLTVKEDLSNSIMAMEVRMGWCCGYGLRPDRSEWRTVTLGGTLALHFQLSAIPHDGDVVTSYRRYRAIRYIQLGHRPAGALGRKIHHPIPGK